MQIQDESYIKWKLFLEGNDEAYSWLYTHHIQSVSYTHLRAHET